MTNFDVIIYSLFTYNFTYTFYNCLKDYMEYYDKNHIILYTYACIFIFPYSNMKKMIIIYAENKERAEESFSFIKVFV